MPRCRKAFRVLLRRTRAQVPGFRCRFIVARGHEFPSARSFAYCEMRGSRAVRGSRRKHPCLTIAVASKLEAQSWERIFGVIAHELGHATALWLRVQHGERDADKIAERLFGARISYDAGEVQTLGRGVRPRPAHLPQ